MMAGQLLSLNADQANQVRGLTVPMHALAPVPLVGGDFVLPDEVLTDPYHALRLPVLQTLSIRVSRPTEDDYRNVDPFLKEQCTYNSSWPVGELIIV